MSDTPEFTLRDGAIKATVWRNNGENGDFFTASFGRTYRDEQTGELRDANSFSGSDLLKVSTLAQEAYQKTRALRQEKNKEQRQGQQQEDDKARHAGRARKRERTRDNGRKL